MATSYSHVSVVNVHGATITVILVNQETSVDACVNELYSLLARSHKKIVGLDVEWKPNSCSKVATLQLCVDTRCFIFQLIHMESIPVSLKSLLMDPHITFLGVGIGNDSNKLAGDYGLVSNNNVIELGPLAVRVLGESYPKNAGLVQLANEVLGLNVSKSPSVVISDWSAKVLTYEQIEYAATDAYLSYKIGEKLHS